MKRRWQFPAILFILSLFLCFSALSVNNITKPGKEATWGSYKLDLASSEKIIDAVSEDKRVYAITSKSGASDYGDTLAIFEMEEDGSYIRSYENDFKNLKPWKIELADIDGDGGKEILTAVRKTTHFDQIEKNRMFIFNYSDGKLIKKWTGSQIAGVWEDFAAGDLVSVKGSELIFIRRTEQGERVSVYYWYHFGFLLLAESEDYEDIVRITIPEENRIDMVYKDTKKEYTVILKVHDDKLIEAD